MTKKTLESDKGYQLTFSTQIFRVANVISLTPQTVYKLSGLGNRPVEGQFYNTTRED